LSNQHDPSSTISSTTGTVPPLEGSRRLNQVPDSAQIGALSSDQSMYPCPQCGGVNLGNAGRYRYGNEKTSDFATPAETRANVASGERPL
jgi:predicted RNA-binding Zn-ribbon protein involved in translation (DUF1610 family)